VPGVYRSELTSLAQKCCKEPGDEEKRLTLERNVFAEFGTHKGDVFQSGSYHQSIFHRSASRNTYTPVRLDFKPAYSTFFQGREAR